MRYHFGISGAHICENFLSEKLSWFARILELKASSQEPLDVDRWQASCCYFLHPLGGDELALGDILQLSSTMDKHKVTRFSYTVALTWTLLHRFVSVRGLWCRPCRVSPFTSQPWPGWGSLNGFPCLRVLRGGRKHIYSLQQGLLLWLRLNAFPPVTGAVRRVEGCAKYQSERAAGRAAAPSDRVSGPAVDLISPIGLLPGKVCLISYTCATSCLSHCLA